MLDRAVSDLGDRTRFAEIAFFGGSFTAIDRDYMRALLKAAQPYLDRFSGIRISTRPDAIDEEVLALLKRFGVTSIELGAQSMDDAVLKANDRGHTSSDVENAFALIRSFGFSAGLQMMTGLYMSDPQRDYQTALEFVRLRPDTVRVYPTVILRGTHLEELYLSGEFKPYSLEESIELCSRLIKLFDDEGIPLIRLGLHYSDSLVQNSLGGNYHPAFRELCESKLFYDSFLEKTRDFTDKKVTVTLNRRSLSKFLGQKKSNLIRLSGLGYEIKLQYEDSLGKYEFIVKQG